MTSNNDQFSPEKAQKRFNAALIGARIVGALSKNGKAEKVARKPVKTSSSSLVSLASAKTDKP